MMRVNRTTIEFECCPLRREFGGYVYEKAASVDAFLERTRHFWIGIVNAETGEWIHPETFEALPEDTPALDAPLIESVAAWEEWKERWHVQL